MTAERGETTVEIRAGFFLVIAFMLLISGSRMVLISLFSSLLHECGHLLALLFCSGKAERIVFSASGMRIDRGLSCEMSFRSEIIISLSGPAVNLLISFVSLMVYYFKGAAAAFDIFAVNAIIALFNLLPVESLDGAGALRFILLRRIPENRTEKIVSDVSLVTGTLLVFFFTLTVFLKKANPSLAVVIIYLLILLINRILQLKKRIL